ncbi:MAG: UDP-N-acetylmuramoyl-tripeptide--D-alanyl-D-alanine ligase [Methyloprofundus sp.]|nr:UDP-N-acetylmuramoyl-tripeptide--D-alanyl-D-alanine ligase [Methyloprofundus sp.]
MVMTLTEIANCVHGQLIGTDVTASGVSIDTRTLAQGDVYIALSGEQFYGHDFIAQAEEAGALALLVTKKVVTRLPQVIVTDSRIALAELAGCVREKSRLRVCAITGSNGKTTVKEMIAAILAVRYQVLFTAGNFNNDIGVPLTLLRLDKQHQFAVVEMGANHIGEIAYSCQYARPDVAVITNVGAAHIEGFGSIEGVAQAKAEIIQSLSADGVAILNADDAFFAQWREIAGQRKLISFAVDHAADVEAENIEIKADELAFTTRFDLVAEGSRIPVSLALAGEHNVLNALAASAACLALGVELQQIQKGLQQVRPVKGRLQLFETVAGGKIINDTYNANPASLAAALKVLKNCTGELWVALGAFGELGSESAQQHGAMAEQIKQAGVERLFVVGAMAENTAQAFGEGAIYYSRQEDLITAIKQAIRTDVVLLVKGSRAQKMERVVEALMSEEK